METRTEGTAAAEYEVWIDGWDENPETGDLESSSSRWDCYPNRERALEEANFLAGDRSNESVRVVLNGRTVRRFEVV